MVLFLAVLLLQLHLLLLFTQLHHFLAVLFLYLLLTLLLLSLLPLLSQPLILLLLGVLGAIDPLGPSLSLVIFGHQLHHLRELFLVFFSLTSKAKCYDKK